MSYALNYFIIYFYFIRQFREIMLRLNVPITVIKITVIFWSQFKGFRPIDLFLFGMEKKRRKSRKVQLILLNVYGRDLKLFSALQLADTRRVLRARGDRFANVNERFWIPSRDCSRSSDHTSCAIAKVGQLQREDTFRPTIHARR